MFYIYSIYILYILERETETDRDRDTEREGGREGAKERERFLNSLSKLNVK